MVRRALEVMVVKFADDTKGAKIIENDTDREKLQEALDCLYEWSLKWGMTFNLEKCKVMHVGKNNPHYEYTMGGVKLSETDEERDIGVMITKTLKPSSQCNKAAARATSVLNQIKRNFHYRDRHTFLRLYKQYVRPHLEFASQAWAPWTIGDKETLEKVQERAVKMVAGLASTDYKERCFELGLDTLEDRRRDQDMALVHKLLIDGQGQDIFKMAGTNENGVRTRRAAATYGLTTQFARTDIRKYSFGVRVVEEWNKLPESVKQAPSKEAFKSRLKHSKRKN